MRSEAAMIEERVVAENLCKTYRLGEPVRLEASLRRLLRRSLVPQRFEALDHVSFDIRPAECFGIVGTNGSGKSTILQIMAGITMPTSGKMTIRGRVLPLLAVGAGFHAELTGRENSLLFGTILGVEREVIEASHEQIASFAEIERHYDTPLKRYSSGMSSRLSFAIAMLFPADVYCFDEVLAVVDGEFRDRCLGEIAALVDRGSTVIFISHDLNQVSELCDRVMWMDDGQVREIGEAAPVLEAYATIHHQAAPD